jgi:tetratricopeptide (TPR) repeat protein
VTGAALLVFAALTVAPSDRLAMADRLFNRGAYAEARAEYAALRGEAALEQDDLLFRLAECDRALGKEAEARAAYSDLLARHPLSKHADRARLMRALSGSPQERLTDLKALDSDRVPADMRAVALYHLGVMTGNIDCFERCVRLAPKGKYAPYAKLHRAATLAKSAAAGDRRKAVSLLLEIAFGSNDAFAEEALYLAATTSYGEKSYGEAGSLLRRYLKLYPKGAHAAEAVNVCAWCDYLGGRYADAIALCGAGADDDTAFLLAASTEAAGDGARAKTLYARYLERFPQGRYRREAELPLLRLEFTEATAGANWRKALECARRAAALSSLAFDQLRVAWALEKMGSSDEAERAYLDVAKKFPGSSEAAEALFRKAMADLREERWSAADLALAEALAGSLEPRRLAEALYWRGIAGIRLGHEAEGAAHLRRALEKGLSLDQAREARLIVADCDLAAGRTEEARTAYRRLVREGATARMSAAKILAVGKMLGGEEARVCARALTAGSSPEWRQAGWALLGATEEAARSYAAAIDAYRKCVAESCQTEDLPRATARLGALEAAAGEWEAAQATLERAVKLNAADVEARAESYLHLAKVSLARNRLREARAYATVVTTLFESTKSAAAAAAILKEYPEKAK